jgi:GA4 desaturase
LTRYGFTAVKHNSTFISSEHLQEDLYNPETIEKIYYPEVKQLIKDLTGCSEVFIDHSFLRGPKMEGVGADGGKSEVRAIAAKRLDHLKDTEHSYHLPVPLPPTRIPHVDSTPLGGRHAIRFWRKDLHDAATRAGIIEAEDKICKTQGVKATEKHSDAILAREYNSSGRFGPRYASFSVWRPIQKVTRDPLALAVRKNVKSLDNDFYLWSYEIRNYGTDGDWHRELEMLRVKLHRTCETRDEVDESIDWCYLSEQEPNEVLVFKLFDSAGLDASAEESEGVPHGSPDLGDAGYGDPRESIEVRLYAVW